MPKMHMPKMHMPKKPKCSRYTSDSTTVKNGQKINNIEGLAQVCAMLSNAAYHYPKKSFPHIINYIFNIKGVDDVIKQEGDGMLNPLPEPGRLKYGLIEWRQRLANEPTQSSDNIKGGWRPKLWGKNTAASSLTAAKSVVPVVEVAEVVDPTDPNTPKATGMGRAVEGGPVDNTPNNAAEAAVKAKEVNDFKKQVNKKASELQNALTPEVLAKRVDEWSDVSRNATAQTMALLANKGFSDSLELFYPSFHNSLAARKAAGLRGNWVEKYKSFKKKKCDCDPFDTSMNELKKTHKYLFDKFYKMGGEGENKYWVKTGDDAFRIGGDINYVYIGTHLDLNLYVVYHKEHKKLFVIFRGTNSGLAVAEDMKTRMIRISEDDLKTTQYHSDVWEKHWRRRGVRREYYYKKKKTETDQKKYDFPKPKEGEDSNNPLGVSSSCPTDKDCKPWTSGELKDKRTIHRGFFEQSRYMFKRVVEAMHFLTKKEEDKEKIDVIYTGHSLGGAHAYIFSYFITANRDKINLPFLNKKDQNGEEKKVYVITWGSPRVGGQTWYNAYMKLVKDKKIVHRRYKTDADGFTTTSGPPIAQGYKQLGDDEGGRRHRKKATVCSKKSGFSGYKKHGALQCMEMFGQCTVGNPPPHYAHLSQASINMYGSTKTMGWNLVKKNNHLFVYSHDEGLESKTVFFTINKPQQDQGGGLSKRKYRKKRTLRKKNKKSHRTLRKKNKKSRRTLRKKNKKSRRTLRKRN